MALGNVVSTTTYAEQGGGSAPTSLVKEQERQQVLRQVQVLRQRADALRREAESRFAASNAACYSKFLVVSCLNDAKQARIKSIQEARRMNLQAGDLERDLNRRSRANDEYRRMQREAEKREQAASGRTERDAELQRGAAKQEEHARRMAQEGALQQQQRSQRGAEKAKARAARVAEAHSRAEATRRQRAEIDRKIAEHERRQAERNAAAQPPGQQK